jgi:hypothetical protein
LFVPRIAVSLSGKEQYIEQTQIKQKPINLQCVSPLDIHIAVSCSLLQQPRKKTSPGCHGLVPWSFTFAAI